MSLYVPEYRCRLYDDGRSNRNLDQVDYLAEYVSTGDIDRDNSFEKLRIMYKELLLEFEVLQEERSRLVSKVYRLERGLSVYAVLFVEKEGVDSVIRGGEVVKDGVEMAEAV